MKQNARICNCCLMLSVLWCPAIPACTCVEDLISADSNDDGLYQLPFESGTSSLVVQGNFGPFSHQQSYAIDFALPVGTSVVAARSGMVTVAIGDCGDCSCWWDQDCECCGFGNYVEIMHDDGTHATYGHLSADTLLVSRGESVQRGQAIALSGHTGYSFMPHVHFEVEGPGGGSVGASIDGTQEVSFIGVCGGAPQMFHTVASDGAN